MICHACPTVFTPRRRGQTCCSWPCELRLAQAKRAERDRIRRRDAETEPDAETLAALAHLGEELKKLGIDENYLKG